MMRVAGWREDLLYALREEGDDVMTRQGTAEEDFYPRPPRGGRPSTFERHTKFVDISIHALREEGDATVT